MLHTIVAIICVIGIGFIAHRVGICLVRAVKLTIEGQPSLLLAILFSGLWVACYSVIANLNAWPQPFTRFAINPLFILGGFIFGVGASINQGCSISTMHQFARGNISMLFTMAGWFTGWCAWMSLSMTRIFIDYDIADKYQQIAPLNPAFVLMLLVFSVLITFAIVVFFPKQRERWIGISLIGLLVSVVFYIEPLWAPSKLIQDTGSALFQGTQVPSIFRVVLLVMLLFGMWISMLVLRNVNLRKPTMHKIIRHGSAGTLMGFGGAMALGGNDSQVLMGIPSLSPGALAAVISMFLGITAEQFLYHRGKLFYQKR